MQGCCKVSFGPLTSCPSPTRGEGRFRTTMRPAPPLPVWERGLGGEGRARIGDFATALVLYERAIMNALYCSCLLTPIRHPCASRITPDENEP